MRPPACRAYPPACKPYGLEVGPEGVRIAECGVMKIPLPPPFHKGGNQSPLTIQNICGHNGPVFGEDIWEETRVAVFLRTGHRL